MEREARFRSMFQATFGPVTRYARYRGLSGQDLEDLVAATYEVAWRRFDDVPEGEEALPWLLAVALNHLRNHRRRALRDRSLLARLPAPEHAPAPPEPAAHSWRDIRLGLQQLSAADRELVLLVAWDGLSPAQAATVLGVTPAAARTRLHRARSRLADILGIARRGGEDVPMDPELCRATAPPGART